MDLRFAVVSVVLSLVVGCSGGPEARKAKRYAEDLLCPQERAQACTMEYMPVCALLEDGRRKEYANACSACSDSDVVSFVPDACP